MRTIIDIPEDQVKALDLIGKKDDLSRAELVRRAVHLYLETQKMDAAETADKYFGFLEGNPDAFGGMDGLEYQEHARDEWSQRDHDYSRWGLHDHKHAPFSHQDDKDKS